MNITESQSYYIRDCTVFRKMNVFVQEIGTGDLEELNHHEKKLVVEDNVGESIHIHVRNFRLEMGIGEFLEFSENMERALEELKDGDS